MHHVKEYKLRYSLSLCTLLLLVCALIAMQPNDPGAIAQQKMVPAPVADSDWDYWTNSPDMSAMPAGNVGIGTATPTAQLDVDGDLQVSDQIVSTLATGTAPLDVASTTRCVNLNADQLDGLSSGDFPKTFVHVVDWKDPSTTDISYPHCKPVHVVIASHNGGPAEVGFVYIIENDNVVAWNGIDGAGNAIRGTSSNWTATTIMTINDSGEYISLSIKGDGSETLVVDSDGCHGTVWMRRN